MSLLACCCPGKRGDIYLSHGSHMDQEQRRARGRLPAVVHRLALLHHAGQR